MKRGTQDDPNRILFSEKFACPVSGFTIAEIEPRQLVALRAQLFRQRAHHAKRSFERRKRFDLAADVHVDAADGDAGTGAGSTAAAAG